MSTEPKAMALRGVHDCVVRSLVKAYPEPDGLKILELGAGQGALTKKIHELGYDITPCEFNKDFFVYDKLECLEADVSQPLPFADNTYDAVVAAEVIEHLLDQKIFFEECARVLKPGGKLILSTPNILSLKSRLQFFSSGYYWSFDPLVNSDRTGLQHVTARTPEQYDYIASLYGLKHQDIDVDKYQSSSRWLMIFLPFMYIFSKGMRKNFRKQNTLKLMLGRVIVLTFERQ